MKVKKHTSFSNTHHYILLIIFFQCPLFLASLLQTSVLSADSYSLGAEDYTEEVKRSDFPDGFLFGASTSAYQVEGAYLEDGKGLNNWDIYTHQPGHVQNGSTGDVSADHYHHYLEDIELLHTMGVNAYRFSISWARILPMGSFGDVNPEGIAFYNRLINGLLLKGIKPFVTIHHNELPHVLDTMFDSWLSPRMQDEYLVFAEVCFRSFGDRVQLWTTVNEANMLAQSSYMDGLAPPGRCSPPFGNCSAGNSVTEPFYVMHNVLLAHAKAVKLYREKYQVRQGGLIGINGVFSMFEPLSNSTEDMEALSRAFAFNHGWMLGPLVYGEYPVEMQNILGTDLPSFTPAEKEIVKGSLDFVGINHYTVFYVGDCLHSSSSCVPTEATKASGFLSISPYKDGVPIGEQTGFSLYCIVPRGLETVVEYLSDKYNNIPIFIAENGYAGVPEVNIQDSINDYKRVEYLKLYIAALARAIRKGADVRGYFVWGLMDSFEWNGGYTMKFGLHHVDFNTLIRTPRLSSKWYSKFLDEKHESKYHYQPLLIKNNGKEDNTTDEIYQL